MMQASTFWKLLHAKGYTFFSGVPCSILEPVLRQGEINSAITYVPAVRENVAFGLASGAYLAGKRSGILMQNSGVGNVINALTSFNLIYKIPVLMCITWRGHLGKDAPEHFIMGKSTLKLLAAIKIPTVILSQDYKAQLSWAIRQIEVKSIPVAVILKKDIIV